MAGEGLSFSHAFMGAMVTKAKNPYAYPWGQAHA